MTHGYARCSTSEDRQDINRQTRELKKQGVERVWLEFEHGDTASKEQQRLMLDAVNPGDTILTLEVSRLARSTKQLCEIIDVIRDKHLRRDLDITMDCRDGRMNSMTEAFLQIAGVFSQLELSMIRERIRSGVENARAKGKQLGRPPVTEETIPDTFYRYYSKYQDGSINLSELARLTRLSRPTVYRYVRILEGTKQESSCTLTNS